MFKILWIIWILRKRNKIRNTFFGFITKFVKYLENYMLEPNYDFKYFIFFLYFDINEKYCRTMILYEIKWFTFNKT